MIKKIKINWNALNYANVVVFMIIMITIWKNYSSNLDNQIIVIIITMVSVMITIIHTVTNMIVGNCNVSLP